MVIGAAPTIPQRRTRRKRGPDLMAAAFIPGPNPADGGRARKEDRARGARWSLDLLFSLWTKTSDRRSSPPCYRAISAATPHHRHTDHGSSAGSATAARVDGVVAVRRSLPDAESIISRFNAELRGMIADRSYHRLLHLDWIRADVDGDGRREYVPHDDQTGPRPPEHSYELFATRRPTAKRRATRRFYFGSIYEGWSAVPERYKAPAPAESDPGRHAVRIFTFTW